MPGKKKKSNVVTLSDGTTITLRQTSTWQYMKHHKWLYIMLLPGLLYFILFKYVPMGGLVIAFKEYSPFRGFLNEVRHNGYKRVVQTLVYVPHFVSWVIVASLTYQLFNVSDGVINMIIKNLTGGTIDILSKGSTFWGLIVGQDIWRETGYGTIIFLAALAGVDQEMYEAARVDGAGRWRLMWHITLPAIKGTIIMMLILRVGGLLNTGYEQIFLMRNDLNMEYADVFDTYIYTRGIVNGQYSFSSAAGMFKSVVGMILVLGSNKISKMCGEAGIY